MTKNTRKKVKQEKSLSKKHSVSESFVDKITNFIEKPKSNKTKFLIDLFICLPIILFTIYYYSNYKVNMMKQNPGYTDKQDIGMFWSETAFQYRYAKMFAENDPQKWEILNKDIKLQYPEGVETWKDYTTFMEPVHGYIYSFFISKNVPFHVYIMWFVSLFSCSIAFIIYYFVRSIWNKQFLALLCSLGWMLIPAGFFRQVSAIYLKEDFSIVFVLLFVFLFIIGFKNERKYVPILGAISLFIALISWHLSQFFFLFLMIAVYLVFIFENEWKSHYTRNLIVYTVTGLVAGFMPVLFQRSFFISQPMIFCYAILTTIYTRKWWIPKLGNRWFIRLFLPFLIIIILSAFNLLFNTNLREYAHVFELFIYKVINFGVIPKDPLQMPFEVRVFWAGNFEGANLEQFFNEFKYLIILLFSIPIIFIYNILCKKYTLQDLMIILILVGSIFISFIISRLTIFLAPVFAISIGLLITSTEKISELYSIHSTKKTNNKSLNIFKIFAYCVIIIIMFVNFQILKAIKPVVEERVDARVELFNWINNNTSLNDAFVSPIGEGPMLLLYTGRPVVLNSQYENSFIRRKTEEFYASYFGNEEDLYKFCQKYNISYVLVTSTMALTIKPGSARFSAGRKGNLSLKSAAALIQFYPETMKNFAPVFDNSQFRIVKVLNLPSDKNKFVWQRGYSSHFDISLFEKNGENLLETDAILDKLSQADKIFQETGNIFSTITQIMQTANQNGELSSANKVHLDNQLQQARNNMKSALELNPKEPMIYNNLGLLEAQVGNYDNALNYLTQGLEIAPSDFGLLGITFDILIRLQKWDKVISLGEKLLPKQDDSSFIYSMMAQAYFSKQDNENAYVCSNRSLTSILFFGKRSVDFNYYNNYYIRGVTAYRLLKFSESEKDLTEFLKNARNPQLKKEAEKIIADIKSKI